MHLIPKLLQWPLIILDDLEGTLVTYLAWVITVNIVIILCIIEIWRERESKCGKMVTFESRWRIYGILSTLLVVEIFQNKKLGKTRRNYIWIYHLLKLLAKRIPSKGHLVSTNYNPCAEPATGCVALGWRVLLTPLKASKKKHSMYKRDHRWPTNPKIRAI